MASLNNRVFDNGLTVLDTEANKLLITSQEATTYAEGNSTYALGNSTSLSVAAPADRNGGNGTATHYAIVDTVNSRLLATGSLTASQVVSSGNTFSLGSFTIGIPDPA